MPARAIAFSSLEEKGSELNFVVDGKFISDNLASMRHQFTTARRVNRKAQSVNPKLSHLIRAALLMRGLTLKAWARAEGISRSQVSMALSGYRTDARSLMIRRQLEELVAASQPGGNGR